MSAEFDPTPEPRGALVPPSRRPPTAIATDTPPPPRPSHVARARAANAPWLLRALGGLVSAALDAADAAGDAIRAAAGLGPGTAVVPTASPPPHERP